MIGLINRKTTIDNVRKNNCVFLKQQLIIRGWMLIICFCSTFCNALEKKQSRVSNATTWQTRQTPDLLYKQTFPQKFKKLVKTPKPRRCQFSNIFSSTRHELVFSTIGNCWVDYRGNLLATLRVTKFFGLTHETHVCDRWIFKLIALSMTIFKGDLPDKLHSSLL